MIKKRIRNTKIGDIFEVKTSDMKKRYLQYIISDLTSLNSDVIRVFKRVYGINEQPSIDDIVSGDVDFYSHTTTVAGIKLGLWEKIGNSQNIGNTDILFRSCLGDLVENDVAFDWHVWTPNSNREYVGKLPDKFKMAEIGLIYAPRSIIRRIETGSAGKYFKF